VLSHLARNADGLVNLVTWAQTGVETPMYASASARDGDIARGATRPAREIRSDVVGAAARLAGALAALDADARHVEVRSATGRALEAARIPWLRVRELWIHAVDLDAVFSFRDIPRPLARALVGDLVDHFSRRDDCPTMRMCSSDDRCEWTIHPSSEYEPPTAVFGPTAALIGWVLGRSRGDDLTMVGPPAMIPRWL
jgi:maleylpyruvate isomerase